MTKHILLEKSYKFALRIVKLSQYLNDEKREFVLSKKILDSGTAVGVLIEEAQQGENRADFLQKYSIANKEAFKTNFWLRLLPYLEWLHLTNRARQSLCFQAAWQRPSRF